MTSNKNTTLGKAALVDDLAKRLDTTKEMAELLHDTFIGSIMLSLTKGSNVRLNGLGTLKVVHYNERFYISPMAKAPVIKPAGRRVNFSMARSMKEAMNNEENVS